MTSFPVRSADIGLAEGPTTQAARRLAMVGLRAASAALGRLALRLERSTPTADIRAAHLEFHCDACAPEGALYLDGRLVAKIPGVRRL